MNLPGQSTVRCRCCARHDKTCNMPVLESVASRKIEAWTCGNCGLPCSNRRCDGRPHARTPDK